MPQSDVPYGDSSCLAFFPHLMKDIDSKSSSAELSTTSARKDLYEGSRNHSAFFSSGM
jgi:hypothetical protein